MNSLKFCPAPTFSLCILFNLIAGHAAAQCNSENGGWTCQEASLVCLNDLCDRTENNPPDDPHNGWCGSNTAVHNPQYFQFVASSDFVIFEISVGDCTGGQNAIQAAILGACPWDNTDVIDCNPGTPEGGSFTLQATGIVVGQTYWIVFDGSASAECEYTIEQATGVELPPNTIELDLVEEVIASPSEVCPGYRDLLVVAMPEVESAHGYWWISSWALQDTLITTDPAITYDIAENMEPGSYEICVRAFSGCDTADAETCTTILVLEPSTDTVIKDSRMLCQDAYPFTWNETLIEAPGTYFSTGYSPDGCAFDSLWTLFPFDSLTISGLSAVAGPCATDSTFVALIDLENNQGDSSVFELLAGEEVIGHYAPEDFPVVISNFPGNATGSYTVSLCRPGANSPDCCLSLSFEGPVCPGGGCRLLNPILTPAPCQAGQQFDFILDFEYVLAGPSGFSVVCNGQLFGPFRYDELPVRFGPFIADSSTYKVLILDNADPSCNIAVNSGIIDCTTALPDLRPADVVSITGNGHHPVIRARQDIRISLYAMDGRAIIPDRKLGEQEELALLTIPSAVYIALIQVQGRTFPLRVVKMSD